MRFIVTLLLAVCIAYCGYTTAGIVEQLGFYGWVVLLIVSYLSSLIVVAVVGGIVQSIRMEAKILKKYLDDPQAVFDGSKHTEPAHLGIISGRWFWVLLHIVKDTWKGFFTEVQWAYKPPKARTKEEVINGRSIYNALVEDDLEGERRYQEWLIVNSWKEKISDISKLRFINGTVFVIVGSILAMFFSVVLLGIGICSLPYVVVFVVAWLIDRIYLIIRKIAQPCGNCQCKNTILHYECPKCAVIHRHLVSGPYGVFRHKCLCGEKLPCTFFNGRSIKAKAVCPSCGSYIKGAGTRPFMIQLIGGSNSGKTVFISAFYHEFLNKIKSSKHVEYKIEQDDESLFIDLEDWYSGVPCDSTKRMNSQMYSVQIGSNRLDVSRKFILYDIAGEMFNSGKVDTEITQKQFHYCNGIVFILDPFSNDNYRTEMERIGEVLPQYSDIESEDVINTFLNYLSKTGNKRVGAVYQTPFSVVITKADVKGIRQRINMIKIKSELNKNPNYVTFEEARDTMCKEFLAEIGLAGLTSIIETRFKNVHYFLASPMGHDPDGSEFDSWGVLEPIEWIIREQDEDMYNVIQGKETI